MADTDNVAAVVFYKQASAVTLGVQAIGVAAEDCVCWYVFDFYGLCDSHGYAKRESIKAKLR